MNESDNEKPETAEAESERDPYLALLDRQIDRVIEELRSLRDEKLRHLIQLSEIPLRLWSCS